MMLHAPLALLAGLFLVTLTVLPPVEASERLEEVLPLLVAAR